ncbi:MAG: MarR family transcriptional regulator [Sulfolobales archaeon]|nr:MarR family transcriptional regulator [Sulfolobales archaeon]MCG2893322.1 MarR family transcriptional regulator [Sulfolobales archaeon]MCG2910931.1 MarR family transcriptional regulator [Sulfolobales archaeon]
MSLESQGKFMLPSGKELTLLDVLSFCYGLSETDVQVLMALLKSSPKSTEDLERELQLSKASVNRSLNKLLSMELVKRIKETGNKAGRPKYLYSAINFDELKGKLVKEIEDCTDSIKKLIMTQLTPSIR